jgi:peptide/nickel transport system substrate-binding protein
MKRRNFLKGLSATAISMSPLSMPAIAQKSTLKTLRIIHSTNLSSLDPVWTTEPGAKDYGFLTFDQLISVDEQYVPQPQMAEGWSIEDDGKTYIIGLRDGLKFHDGEPVRSQDCIPSIERWGARDGFGQMMMRFVDAMEVIDDRKFRIRLKKPFPLLPAAIGKSSSSQCFIMPERMAKTDPMTAVTESIGSGPYRFLRDEWVPGAKAAWGRFEGYIPRKEPVSGIAGGRVPVMDRIEWSIITDASTAMAALQAGEQDLWDIPSPDLIPVLEADPNITLSVRNPTGTFFMLQLNHQQPPFNNPAVRQAVAMAVDQMEFMRAIEPDTTLIRQCNSFYACGTPNGGDAGSDVLTVKNVEKAKAALKAAGYAGEKVVILAVMIAPLGPLCQVAEDLLRRIGMNVELVAMDFATMAQRRTSKEPVDKGGWSMFVTGWTGADILNPAVNQLLRSGGVAKGWYGWADDPALESLRDQWANAGDVVTQAKLATDIQIEAFKSLPYIPIGEVSSRVAYRKNLTGVFPCPVFCYWNIGKNA